MRIQPLEVLLSRAARGGGPSQSSTNNQLVNQKDLHFWFTSGADSSKACSSQSWDMSHFLPFMLSEYRGPTCEYGGKIYEIRNLLNDSHRRQTWFLEPHT